MMERWGEKVVNEAGYEMKHTKDALCSICLVDYTVGNVLRWVPEQYAYTCVFFHRTIIQPILNIP